MRFFLLLVFALCATMAYQCNCYHNEPVTIEGRCANYGLHRYADGLVLPSTFTNTEIIALMVLVEEDIINPVLFNRGILTAPDRCRSAGDCQVQCLLTHCPNFSQGCDQSPNSPLILCARECSRIYAGC